MSHADFPMFSDTSQNIAQYWCEDNAFNISYLKEFYKPVGSRGFAIKYVTAGVECYTVGSEKHFVTAGSYLLINGERDASVEIESKQNVKGICISITPGTVADIVASLCGPDTPVPDPNLSRFFEKDHFPENQYHTSSTFLGKQLMAINREISGGDFSSTDVNKELFWNLAQHLVTDQTAVYQQFRSVRAVKSATRRDLFKRLSLGKIFIDNHFNDGIGIPEIANEVAMSDFHFFRLFKQVFGISPYQYILQKRLSQAHHLLKSGTPVSQVAFESDFSDVFAFSKAFKKHFGYPPSRLMRN